MYDKLFSKYFYPFYESKLRKRNTFSYYAEYMSNQYLSLDELEYVQGEKLKKLLQHCYENVAYYKNLWDGLGFTPQDYKGPGDLKLLPVLTKDIIKNNYNELIAENYRDKTIAKATGGSTGVPLRFAITRESYEKRVAVTWRGYEWSGAGLGKKTAYIWGQDFKYTFINKLKYGLYNQAFNRKYFNVFEYNHNFERLAVELKAYNPKVIVSFVTPLYEFAVYLLANNIQLDLALDAIVTGAEALQSHQRDLIEKAFSKSVTNTYGCREFMLLAAECDRHEGMHINIDHVVLELENSNSLQGDIGEVVITDLSNYGMPFIRYKNGDLASYSDQDCSCGRRLPMLASVHGRVLDAIKRPDGSLLPGEFFPHLLKDLGGLLQFQIVQNDINSLDINLVTDGLFEKSALVEIEAVIRNAMHEDLLISFNFLETIPTTDMGKTRVTISHVEL